jgi:hypothetical protein
MLKNNTVLEIKIGERNYQFYCSPDSPLGELYDVLHQMKSFIVQKILDAEKETKPEQE